MNNVNRGKEGEALAAKSLETAGMRIVARNYRSKSGEIDIIAIDNEMSQQAALVFVEVKSWSAFGIEDLQYGIDIRKQRKIIKTAKYFLLENRKYSNMPVRFDVVFVKGNQITHLASAFTERV